MLCLLSYAVSILSKCIFQLQPMPFMTAA